MESNLCKIFVGNVPFQCTQEEFEECFNKMEGFIKADIVWRPGTNISRGFGFVTFDSPKHAKILIGNEDVKFKDRILRFTEYTFSNYCTNESSSDSELFSNQKKTPGSSKIQIKNFLIVRNLKDNTTREDIYNLFRKYGEIGRYFIMSDQDTGSSKSSAIVEIIDDTLFDFLIKQKELVINGNHVLELSKWKSKVNINQDKKITKYDLFRAFTAGKNVGMVEAKRSKNIIKN